jgi:putative membrane protein
MTSHQDIGPAGATGTGPRLAPRTTGDEVLAGGPVLVRRSRFLNVSRDLLLHARFPLALLALYAVVAFATLWAPPAGRLSWALEVGPGLILVAVLAGLYRGLPLSHFVYGCVFLHLLVLTYGGYYTYAMTPLGNWARDTFHLARNHYDRVGHLALGVFPSFLAKEILLRRTPLRRGPWLTFLVLSVILAFAAFWELLEWWVALLVAPDVGVAFLGAQGDPWDAQWDMFLALVGAAIALPTLGAWHDASMGRVPESSRAGRGIDADQRV